MTRKKAEWETGYEKAFNNPPPLKQVDPCNPLQDLTDDEIESFVSEHRMADYIYRSQAIAMCRAVIAADREKNK